MLLVSQFHFVYWYNTVLVVLTRSASFVDVECMLSIAGQILNGKQSSLHRRSQDFVCGAHFFREKVDIYSRRPQIKTHTKTT